MCDEKKQDVHMYCHFDNLLWQVSSMLMATNGVLINAFVGADNTIIEIFICVLGFGISDHAIWTAKNILRSGPTPKHSHN